jgi:hypothetical protein
MNAWVLFTLIQLSGLVTDSLGFVVLALPCYLNAWEPAMSTEWNADAPVKAHEIMVWKWAPLNVIWGNPEDGVLGPDWHLPGEAPGWRAFCWSALRNRSDAMKYVYRRDGGPFKRWDFTVFGTPIYFQMGWNSSGLPTVSGGRA